MPSNALNDEVVRRGQHRDLTLGQMRWKGKFHLQFLPKRRCPRQWPACAILIVMLDTFVVVMVMVMVHDKTHIVKFEMKFTTNTAQRMMHLFLVLSPRAGGSRAATIAYIKPRQGWRFNSFGSGRRVYLVKDILQLVLGQSAAFYIFYCPQLPRHLLPIFLSHRFHLLLF